MEAYKSLHAEQSLAMAQLESKIADLEEENRLLKMELTDLKSKLGYYEQRGVDDASTLDEIESSIQQFHSFLDLLRSKGLEDVCTLVQKGDIEQVNRS
jgi:regulator of replication initiation timing